jgi:hypothetical protein
LAIDTEGGQVKMELIDTIFGSVETSVLRIGVLVIATVSLLIIGYVLLLKSNDSVSPNGPEQ